MKKISRMLKKKIQFEYIVLVLRLICAKIQSVRISLDLKSSSETM